MWGGVAVSRAPAGPAGTSPDGEPCRYASKRNLRSTTSEKAEALWPIELNMVPEVWRVILLNH